MIDYPAHLAAMWEKAIAPRELNAPTVISTFAGGGGSLTGYLMAGYRDLLAVEWDNNAVATLGANYPDLDIYHGDIAKLTVDEVLKRTGLEPGQLDILDGSPPCQGFSTAGKRVMDDPRNQLFREYVRLLRGLGPKVFVMENVSGMVKGKMKLIFVDILKELKASGYRVSAKLLNAMYFHVPQSRERMIFIGVRNDLGIEPTHPKAEGRPVTVGEAWQTVKQELAPYLSPKLASIIPFIPTWGDGGDVVNSFFSTKRLSFAYPSRTLIKGNIGSRACYVHPSENRAITEAEAKRIASFPDDYLFLGGYKKSFERIGNSVPPLFMEAIARHVRSEILSAITCDTVK
jgi:DNA (cytosine-5)-methyltransferase 1